MNAVCVIKVSSSHRLVRSRLSVFFFNKHFLLCLQDFCRISKVFERTPLKDRVLHSAMDNFLHHCWYFVSLIDPCHQWKKFFLESTLRFILLYFYSLWCINIFFMLLWMTLYILCKFSFLFLEQI